MGLQDVCLYLTLLCLASTSVAEYSLNDVNSPTPYLIRKVGYQCEIHSVKTEDGYLLNLHRIPGGRNKPLNTSLTPILLQHGLFDSSSDWILSGPGKGLGYILADMGYDVWMGNARGNIYSREHTAFSTDDVIYWNWSWHEMGYYDLPAVLDYILETTGHKQLHYVGHSMGTTMFFVLCSTRPEYNDKIRSMIALAPVAFMEHVESPLIRLLIPYTEIVQNLAIMASAGELLPRTSTFNKALKYGCDSSAKKRTLCQNLLFFLTGADPGQSDEEMIPMIMGHSPAGQSTKTLLHYGQEMDSGMFQPYDYGPEGNPFVYDSLQPPPYNLSLVTAPVALIYSQNDLLANPTDVNKLYLFLDNPMGLFEVNLTTFNHLDFLWGKDAKTLVYDQVVYLLKTFEDETIRCVQPKKSYVNGVLEVQTRPCSFRDFF